MILQIGNHHSHQALFMSSKYQIPAVTIFSVSLVGKYAIQIRLNDPNHFLASPSKPRGYTRCRFLQILRLHQHIDEDVLWSTIRVI